MKKNPISEGETKELLLKYDFPLPKFMILNGIEGIGKFDLEFPVVLKVSSPEIMHKTDVGGIVMDIKDEEELIEEFTAMKEKFDSPMIVEEQIKKGFEVIVGIIEDSTFGLAIMFGVGGILAELYKDVSFRVLPIAEKDARAMVSEIKAKELFEGFRGIKLDIEALIELLMKTSDLALSEKGILQLDLNPVFLYEKGLKIVDAKMIKKMIENV